MFCIHLNRKTLLAVNELTVRDAAIGAPTKKIPCAEQTDGRILIGMPRWYDEDSGKREWNCSAQYERVSSWDSPRGEEV